MDYFIQEKLLLWLLQWEITSMALLQWEITSMTLLQWEITAMTITIRKISHCNSHRSNFSWIK
jgi:hypothetical protein